MWAAEGLAETCWAISVDQETGLGPDEVVFGKWGSTREKGKDGECRKKSLYALLSFAVLTSLRGFVENR